MDEMNGRRHAVLDKIRAIGDSSEHTVRTTEEVDRFLGQLENAIDTFRLN